MAHVTDLGFTMLELGKAIDDGDVRVQYHPEFPNLAIHNYTEDVQYRNRWNKITLACRGLIIDVVTGEVIARPWEKFFNFGQRDNRIDSDAPVEVTDKVDGSLGILYRRPDGEFAIATRGSFASEQALHATELLNTKYAPMFEMETGIAGDGYVAGLVNQWTHLFEIVYPDNRIVCNYGDMDDLVMLGAVHKQYGHYEGPTVAASMLGWPGPVTEVWKYDRFVDALSFPDRQGKEGVVIRSGRNIVKLKQADYVELHRIITNLSPKTIWEMLQQGKTIGDICAEIPDEFHGYVENIGDELEAHFADIKFNAVLEFNEIKNSLWSGPGTEISRRAWAERIKKSTHPALLFNLLDGKPIDDSIWKMIKPRGDIKSLVEDEG